jgi:tRNA nucleotidyltransferase (CCA-adding enzyme)
MMMELRRLQAKIPGEVRLIMKKFNENGHETYLVGGSVRDLVMDRIPPDYDLTTSALPAEMVALFPQTKTMGSAYGTVTIIQAGLAVEVTTMRNEGDYQDGRRPTQVTFTRSIIEDLRRRDFTINAMAFDGGVLLDPFHGMRDIRSQLIRTVGNPDERFGEDGLRLLRAVRLSAQLGFAIDPGTRDSLIRNGDMICKVSVERIRPELEAVLLSQDPARGCLAMTQAGLLSRLGFVQDVTDDMLLIQYWQGLSNLSFDLTVSLAMFILLSRGKYLLQLEGNRGCWKEYLESLLASYAYPRRWVNSIIDLVMEACWLPYRNRADIRRMLKRIGKDNAAGTSVFLLEVARFLNIDSRCASRWQTDIREIIALGECTSVEELAINGRDLLRIGIPEGPEVGQTLELLLERVLDEPKLNTREKLARLVREELLEASRIKNT